MPEGRAWTAAELAEIDRGLALNQTSGQIAARLPGRSLNATRLRVGARRAELAGSALASASIAVHALPAIDDAQARNAASRDVARACRQLLRRMIETGQHCLHDTGLIATRYAEVARG